MIRTLTFAATLALALPAAAHDYAVGDITIEHPFTFATAPNQPVGGGYLRLVNEGETDDTLIAARVAPEIAGMVQLHEMVMDGDVMRMSEIDGGIPVPAGETVVLERGGLHVMFMQLPDRLMEGERFAATLVFDRAGEVEVEFAIEARGEHGGHGHGHGGHGDGAAHDHGSD